MKYKSGAFLFAGILLSLFSSCSTYLNYQPIGEIKYGTRDNDLAYSSASEKVLIYNAYPEDMELDRNNNIYICEKYGTRILKYSSDMKLLGTIELSNYLKPNRWMFEVDIETDTAGNLYALITTEDRYITMVKYNSSGALVNDFTLSINPGALFRDFFISNTGKIFINQFPINIQDKENNDKGLVYVYTLDGKFLGRTDYFIEDENGFAYKRNLLNNGQLEINRFTPQQDTILTSSFLKVKDTLKSDVSEKSWHFLGVDNNGKIYFSQGVDNLVLRKFDFNTHKVEIQKINLVTLQKDGMFFKNKLQNICLSAGGDIYISAIKPSLPQISEYDKLTEASDYSSMDFKNMSLILIKYSKE